MSDLYRLIAIKILLITKKQILRFIIKILIGLENEITYIFIKFIHFTIKKDFNFQHQKYWRTQII